MKEKYMKEYPPRVKVGIDNADALTYQANVLILKYAQMFYGVDAEVARRFAAIKRETETLRVPDGHARLVDSEGAVTADRILIVGVKHLYSFGYRDVREFARCALRTLAKKAPHTRQIAMTLHGAGYGLDEIEAFESELAGIIDAINDGAFPKALDKITIVELNSGRAKRLAKALEALLPTGFIETDLKAYLQTIQPKTTARLRAAGYASESKPRVFVAMPFTKDMDDVYYYGIEGPVRSAGFVCERADLANYTGDVLTWVKKRIKEATLVIAELTTANPNVYLEVGYAWGIGIPTVLLAKDAVDLKFDIRGQRCLLYTRIKDLEEALTKELHALKGEFELVSYDQ
jgi:hypothetical protein